jgi:DNA modification methylase
LLQRYTSENDLVVDPMCGSGTTIDVAKELNRRVIGYDLNVVRPDVIKNDARKIPIDDSCVDFVFIDSPYSDNIKYSENKKCIGNISCEDPLFFKELGKVAKEIYRILKPGKAMAWLIGDQWIKKKFTPTGFLLYQLLERYFETLDIICVTRHNQTSNTGLWHNRARRFNFYLRGFKYLFIMRKKL